MKLKFILLVVLSCSVLSSAFCVSPTYAFKEGESTTLEVADSLRLFIDQESRYSIDEVLRLGESSYVPISALAPIEASASIWTRIELSNEQARSLQLVFRFYKYVDSLWVYTIEQGELVDVAFGGHAVKSTEKGVGASYNSLPFSLSVGKTNTYFFKLKVEEFSCSTSCLAGIQIMSAQEYYASNDSTILVQSFYAGLMLLFSLLSILCFSVFREWFFTWFSLLIAGFVVYFLLSTDVINFLFGDYQSELDSVLEVLVVAWIVLTAALFVSSYLDLRERSRNLQLAYVGLAGFTFMVPYLSRLFVSNWDTAAYFLNRLAFVWVLVSIGVVAAYVRKSEKSSLLLAFSAAGLFLGALLHFFGMSGVLDENFIVRHSFQVGTVLFSIILAYGMVGKVSQIRSDKVKFEGLDQFKSKFFANISHEFRTPLTLVMGPIKDVLRNTENAQDRGKLKLAYANSERLLLLINQLLDLSKLESNKMQLYAKEQNLAVILKGIVMSFESMSSQRNVKLNFVSQNEFVPVYVDRDKVEIIFINLISNAFKFSQERDGVSVMLTERDGAVEVLVRDSGIGIAPARLPDIFDRFFQAEVVKFHDQEGTGIGLALVKELVELHRGEIRVESEVGVGTTFTVTLQKGSTHLSDEEIVEASNRGGVSVSQQGEVLTRAVIDEQLPIVLSPNEDQRDLPIVLVIEDNGSLRTYFKEILVDSFRVVEAADGLEGLKKAYEVQPDLVVSDVMMPFKDGFQVCAELKTDQRTSHIPVILLTAKIAAEEKLEGLQTGADDYLIKPFDSRELDVRVRNLIDSRQALREKFSQLEAFQPKKASSNAVDQAFLEKVYSTVDAHLADEQFGVEFLANEVGLSKSQLNRKLKALTDETPNKFIQSVRLRKAKALLLEGELNVSEIGLQTGFNSTAYFVKCFGDKYGQTPGSFRAQ